MVKGRDKELVKRVGPSNGGLGDMDRLNEPMDPGADLGFLDTHSNAPTSAAEVFHTYGQRVYHMARKMVRSEPDAEDVTQDVLLQVIRKLPTFRGESAFPTWLHRITVNAALSHRRKQAVREDKRVHDPLEILLEEQWQRPDDNWVPEPERVVLDRETQVLIDRAIDDLPAIYRDVFVLSDVQGVPNATIADTLGLSLPAMKSRLHRARLLLRDVLAPHFSLA